MDRDGTPRTLKDTRAEFLKDLVDTFGERSGDFGEDLRVLLFELWVRARSRSHLPGADVEPKPTEEMKQDEFESRLGAALTFPRTPSLQQQFVEALNRSLLVGQGIKRTVLGNELMLEHQPDPAQFAQSLEQCLRISTGLVMFRDNNRVELGSTSGSQNLPPDWVPVAQHKGTGKRAGVDVLLGQSHTPRHIDTFLVYDKFQHAWAFPSPRPRFTYDQCSHVRLWVDGVEVQNALCTWLHAPGEGFTGAQDLTHVELPSEATSVRATYTALITEYL